ncbi:MAG: DUF2029 domain-containing protein [Chloroflexi bacterium]|nr:DUF2029 domain-containing protein [Chloroflexota bacterium]
MRKGQLEQGKAGRPLVSLFLVLLVSLSMMLTALAIHRLFTGPHPGANDFYIPWRAVRALVVEGRNPYSPEVTRDIQQVLFGGPRPPGTHQFAFAYPLTVLPLLAPLAPLPYDWAEAIWLTVLLGALLGGFFLALRAIDWTPRPWALAGLATWTILFYPAARALILGQMAVIVFLLVALTLFLLRRGQWAGAGICLALTTLKPQMVALMVLLLLVWGAHQRMWRFVGGFLGTMVTMVVIPMLWLPTWPLDFIESTRAYAGYTENTSPVRVMLHLFGFFAPWWEIGLTVLLCLFLAREIWHSAHSSWYNLLPLTVLSLVVGLLIFPRTATTNQVLLIIPILWWVNTVQHNPLWVLGAGLVLLALLIGGWTLFLATTQGSGSEALLMYAPFPWAALLLTIPWSRKEGWIRGF